MERSVISLFFLRFSNTRTAWPTAASYVPSRVGSLNRSEQSSEGIDRIVDRYQHQLLSVGTGGPIHALRTSVDPYTH